MRAIRWNGIPDSRLQVQQLRKSILVLDHEISSDISTIEVSTIGGRPGGGRDSNSMSLGFHQTMAVARAVHSDNVDYMYR